MLIIGTVQTAEDPGQPNPKGIYYQWLDILDNNHQIHHGMLGTKRPVAVGQSVQMEAVMTTARSGNQYLKFTKVTGQNPYQQPRQQYAQNQQPQQPTYAPNQSPQRPTYAPVENQPPRYEPVKPAYTKEGDEDVWGKCACWVVCAAIKGGQVSCKNPQEINDWIDFMLGRVKPAPSPNQYTPQPQPQPAPQPTYDPETAIAEDDIPF